MKIYNVIKEDIINMEYEGDEEDEFLLTDEGNDSLVKKIIEIVDLNKQTDDCVTIFCYYKDCNFEINYDGYIFFVEIINRTRPLLKRCVNFANESEMIAFAVLIYDKFKKNFGEAGFEYKNNSIGECFASGSADFNLEKGAGINYVCYDIDQQEFTRNSKENIQYKKIKRDR